MWQRSEFLLLPLISKEFKVNLILMKQPVNVV